MDNFTKPNIVFIVLDTHRWDRLGLYGYARPVSPNLDAFAERATVYNQAVSPAQWTIPAHASFFTGEFPTTHQTTQSGHSLPPHFPTLAEWLRTAHYQRVGFCNNPLVGVIDNGLKRGFERFYNYGGAVPSVPAWSTGGLKGFSRRLWEGYTQLLRRISYPVQNAVARSERVLSFTLNPALVPLWTKFANFKGDTRRSLQDAQMYLQRALRAGAAQNTQDRPEFVFINLMETHLPFTPPETYLTRLVPELASDRAARDFMNHYNSLALNWLLPLSAPFSDLEQRSLHGFYDAEVAYQDDLLAPLLEMLAAPEIVDNTLVILAGDHGEMLGEHDFMGHSFRVYEELVHVPLIVRFPGQQHGVRVAEPTSTNQIFHTIMEAAGLPLPGSRLESLADEVQRYSLRRSHLKAKPSPYPSGPAVVSEAYPPTNVLRIMEKHAPELIARFDARLLYRAIYGTGKQKLVQQEVGRQWLFDLDQDPTEAAPQHAEREVALAVALERFVQQARERQPQGWQRAGIEIDEQLQQRLRGLGYLE
jgi:uncharacterized sulfatase